MKNFFLYFFCGFFIFLWISGCDSYSTSSLPSSPKKKQKNKLKIVPVQVVPAKMGSISSTITGTCTIEVEQKVDIFAEIGGIVAKTGKMEGEFIQKKEILLKLKDEKLRLDLKKVTAEVAKQKSFFESVQQEYEKNLISKRDYDDASHKLALAKIQKEQTEALLKKTEIHPPFSGVITEKYVTLGEQIFANKKVYRLENLESMIAQVFVPESEILNIKIGQKSKIWVDSLRKFYQGKVKRISPVIDRQSGMAKVTIEILPPRIGLKPGAFARVTIIIGEWNKAILIPKKALVYRAGKIKIFVLGKNQIVQERDLVLGVGTSMEIQVLKGVQLGESVVVSGHYGLQNKQKVKLFSLPSKKKDE